MLAILAAAGLALALPDTVAPGPRGLVPAIVVVLLVPTVIAHRTRRRQVNRALALAMLTVLTGELLAALGLLVLATIRHAETPAALLGSALELWTSNVLVFAAWYWRLDAGGPHARDLRAHAGERFHGSAFLFPQLTLPADSVGHERAARWRPGFVDYLFVAFNTSTAFSPTDAPVLDPWAKLLMMLQATISLTTLAVLAARAVNIL